MCIYEQFETPIYPRQKKKKKVTQLKAESCVTVILKSYGALLPSPNMETKRRTHTLTKSLLNHKCYLFAHFCAASEGQEVHSLISSHCCPAQWDTKHCVQQKKCRQKSGLHLPHTSASTRETFKARISLKHQATELMAGKLPCSQKKRNKAVSIHLFRSKKHHL